MECQSLHGMHFGQTLAARSRCQYQATFACSQNSQKLKCAYNLSYRNWFCL